MERSFNFYRNDFQNSKLDSSVERRSMDPQNVYVFKSKAARKLGMVEMTQTIDPVSMPLARNPSKSSFDNNEWIKELPMKSPLNAPDRVYTSQEKSYRKPPLQTFSQFSQSRDKTQGSFSLRSIIQQGQQTQQDLCSSKLLDSSDSSYIQFAKYNAVRIEDQNDNTGILQRLLTEISGQYSRVAGVLSKQSRPQPEKGPQEYLYSISNMPSDEKVKKIYLELCNSKTQVEGLKGQVSQK